MIIIGWSVHRPNWTSARASPVAVQENMRKFRQVATKRKIVVVVGESGSRHLFARIHRSGSWTSKGRRTMVMIMRLETPMRAGINFWHCFARHDCTMIVFKNNRNMCCWSEFEMSKILANGLNRLNSYKLTVGIFSTKQQQLSTARVH